MSDTILIVDDESIVTDTLSMLIRLSLGKNVITYNDPNQALQDEHLKDHRVALVISDFLMPGMNGLEFLKGVKAITPGTVSILLTGYADKENAIRGINEIGLYHYVEKPWDNHELITTIQNGLEKKYLSDQLQEKIIELNRANLGLEQTVIQRTAAIRNLLDNTGQGFLTFGADLRIDEEYSRQCRRIFSSAMEYRPFPEVLFPTDAGQREFIVKLLGKIFTENVHAQKELFLSLLPEEVVIGGRCINIEYRLITDSTESHEEIMMVILTDLTDQRVLEAQMEEERGMLQVVAKVAADPALFFQWVDDYRTFFGERMEKMFQSNPSSRPIGNEIMRNIHTFKGSSAYWGMTTLPRHLHEMEDAVAAYLSEHIESPMSDSAHLLSAFTTVEWLEEELQYLRRILGDDFFRRQELLEIEQFRIDQLKETVFNILPPHESRALLPEIEQLRYSPFKKMLLPYPECTLQLAQEYEKLILPFEITGGNFLTDSRKYGPFCRALIHIFRNIVHHAIETPDERVEMGKLESGRVVFEVALVDEDIRIIISDDGRGINTERIRARLLEKGLLSPNEAEKLSDEDTLGYIFADTISTLDYATPISGRGMGLSAVKTELDKLGGSLHVQSQSGVGTRFEFRLPLKRSCPLPPSIFPIILQTLIHDAEIIITELIEKPGSIEALPCENPDSVLLLDYTGIIPMKGAIRGGLILTVEKDLAHRLALAMSQSELRGDEIDDCGLDAVVECANILLGKAIHSLPEIETLVMENPWRLRSEHAIIHHPGFLVRGIGVHCAAGDMRIYFMLESGPEQSETI